MGSTVTFGRYTQSKDGAKAPIEWLVLAKEGGKALLISKYCLDAKPYNQEYTGITWENCTLRKWLNGDFINAAFTQEEQNKILPVTNQNPNNVLFGTSGGNPTRDKVFLLSIDEADRLFKNDEARICKPTAYAKERGAYVDDDSGNGWWWLRSPGAIDFLAAYVLNDGSVYANGSGVYYDDCCVRPALLVSNL